MKTLRIAALAALMLSISACADRSDPTFLWLLSLGTTDNTTVTEPAPVDPAADPNVIQEDFSVVVSDVSGDPDFVFDTLKTIRVNIGVRDPVAPISGSLVQIIELADTAGRVLFKATTSEDGNVTGSFTINKTTNIVRLKVNYNSRTYTFDIDITNLAEVRRTIYMSGYITPVTIVDTDGDGIPDEEDSYPNDPTRGTLVRYPGQGAYTIAFEDLYPAQGDADFNDFVIRAVQEEDLNAKGEVVRIRGAYDHMAKGAGYDHTLHMNLPVNVGARLSVKRYNPAGALLSERNEVLSAVSGTELMPRSNTTIAVSNTNPGGVFQIGDRFEYEMVLDRPVSKTELGAPPYDLFLYVIRTRSGLNKVLVSVRSVEAHKEGAGWFTVADFGDQGRVIDLLSMNCGDKTDLGAMNLPAGNYTELRLNLNATGNQVEVLRNGTPTLLPLTVPSGTTTGLKINHPFVLNAAGGATIFLDFDAEKSITTAGGRYILRPVIGARDVAAADGRLYLTNWNPQREIHFAGKHFGADGKDLYLDATGFPWALLMPVDWKWPYERGNIHDAYPAFRPWYTSAGTTNMDWYNQPNPDLVFTR